jgi:hypothetical protein
MLSEDRPKAEIVGRQSFTALPNWIIRKRAEDAKWLSCTEFSILVTLQFFANGAGADSSVFPSYNTIAMYSGVSKRCAIDCIDSLIDKKLVRKETRKNKDGQQSNIYKLMIWSDGEPVRESGGGAGAALGGVQDLHWGGAGFAPKQEPMNKKREEIPPVSPRQIPTPPTPSTDTLSPGSATKRVKATQSSVPDDLRPLSELICSFFNDHKAGARTQRAFAGLILQLRKILQDKSGGMQHVKKQLQVAIEKSQMGEKKWNSITYENWERFGKQKTPAWQINNRPSTQAVTTIFDEDAASDLQF